MKSFKQFISNYSTFLKAKLGFCRQYRRLNRFEYVLVINEICHLTFQPIQYEILT
jgi:hypothetical protein